MATPKINNSSGLCLTCNNAMACYYHTRRGPALFCEMFDDYVTPVWRAEERPLLSWGTTGLRTAAEDVAKYVGLCANCGQYATCRYPKPEGGLWHCEDYE